MATGHFTADGATLSFSRIASNRDTLRTFVACIGDAHAPSRLRAAAFLAICETVVDVGCGPAVGLDSLRATAIATRAPRVPRYFGVDPVLALLEFAVAKQLQAGSVIRLRSGAQPWALQDAIDEGAGGEPWGPLLLHADPLATLRSTRDKAVDGVLVRHVLEHLREPWALLDHCARVTGRRLVVVLSQESRGPVIAHDRGGIGTRPLLTDAHLGAERWSHYRPHLLDRAAVHGLTCVQQLRGVPDGLCVREELLAFERTGEPA